MKARAFLLVLICPIFTPLTMRLVAQDQPRVKEPEEINQFYFLESTGEIRMLEQQPVKARVISADSSDFRFVQGEPLAFVLKVASQDADPKKIIQFFRLTAKGDSRITPEEATKGSKKNAVPGGTIDFDAVEYGESSFKIKPKRDLGPGEYAFRLSNGKDAYCFAVDPVKTDLK